MAAAAECCTDVVLEGLGAACSAAARWDTAPRVPQPHRTRGVLILFFSPFVIENNAKTSVD